MTTSVMYSKKKGFVAVGPEGITVPFELEPLCDSRGELKSSALTRQEAPFKPCIIASLSQNHAAWPTPEC